MLRASPPTSWTIQGRTVTMPVEVRDAANGVAMFMVPAAAAQTLVPGDDFEIVDVGGGQAQLVLGIVDYRDNDLGDYNEVAIVLFVRPRGAAPESAGTYIYKLPVNQSFTCEAGARIWGFPKTVEEITYAYTDDRATGTLVMDGRHVFTLTLPRGEPAPGTPADAPMEGVTYTYIDGRPHRTRFTTGGAGTIVIAGGEGTSLVLGTHPIADALRSLGLPAAPMLTTWTEHMRGTFDAPEAL
jgi:hypothetical protein